MFKVNILVLQGQTAEDVADSDLTSYLEDLRKKQAVLLRGRNISSSGAILPPAKRSSVSNQAVGVGKRRSLDNNITISTSGNNNNITTQPTNNQQIMYVKYIQHLVAVCLFSLFLSVKSQLFKCFISCSLIGGT
jgi:hypothetical protein